MENAHFVFPLLHCCTMPTPRCTYQCNTTPITTGLQRHFLASETQKGLYGLRVSRGRILHPDRIGRSGLFCSQAHALPYFALVVQNSLTLQNCFIQNCTPITRKTSLHEPSESRRPASFATKPPTARATIKFKTNNLKSVPSTTRLTRHIFTTKR